MKRRAVALALNVLLSAGPVVPATFTRMFDSQCFSSKIFMLVPPFLPSPVPADSIPHPCTNALAFDSSSGMLAVASGKVFGVLGIDLYRPPYSGASAPFVRITPGGLTHPRQIAWDGSGNFWVADDTANKVYFFKASFSASSQPAAQNDVAHQPVGLAINPVTGLMFIGDGGGSKACDAPCHVYVVPRPYTGAPVATLDVGNSVPAALAVDQLGRLFVGFDSGDLKGFVSVYVPPFVSGQAAAYRLNAGDGVESLAFDSAQNLYAQLYNTGGIVMFNGLITGSQASPSLALGCPAGARCIVKNWAGLAFGP